MTKDLYDTLSFKEKAMYDELCGFSKKLTVQLDVLTALMQKLLDVATNEI